MTTPAIAAEAFPPPFYRALLPLARMLQFGDSMLPVGTFAFSCALESAVQKGVVRDTETLGQFVLTTLAQAARLDAVGAVHATAAFFNGGLEAATDIDREIYCRKLSAEARLMTTRTGRKLAEMSAAIINAPALCAWRDAVIAEKNPGTWPVSLAVLFAAMGVSQENAPEEVLAVLFYGTAAMLLNAAIRLMRVTHTDIQRILYETCPHFQLLAQTAMATPLEDMSGFAPMTDILAAVHAQAHVRLFMS